MLKLNLLNEAGEVKIEKLKIVVKKKICFNPFSVEKDNFDTFKIGFGFV